VLQVTKPDARCAITTQDPNTGMRDLDTLRTIIGYRGLREGKHADFGVLADVVTPGRIRVGDAVTLLD
jgi:MOSC domain-containing protein